MNEITELWLNELEKVPDILAEMWNNYNCSGFFLEKEFEKDNKKNKKDYEKWHREICKNYKDKIND